MPRTSKTITTKRVGANPSGGITKRLTGIPSGGVTLRLPPGSTDFDDTALIAVPGAIVVTGLDASIIHNTVLNATVGAITVTGPDAVITYTAPGGADYWQLEANTDRWLLEDGDLWVLEG